MGAYHPTSRRPIADLFRKTAGLAVTLCVRWGIHPDTISYSSIVAATAAAICFWQSGRSPFLLLVLAPAFCYIRLWLNMLDGMVALASGKASAHGEIVNDFPDRISDILIFVGVAHSGLAAPDLAYLAAVLAVLTAYSGLFGQAVGVQREFSGVMSKPWRMVVLHLGAWATLARLALAPGAQLRQASLMDVALAVILLGCLQTIAVRLSRIRRALVAKGARA
jgi:phosphatidylglycerophosphate synthase